jgi:ribosome-associated protein
VNKVSTRVELLFDIAGSKSLTDVQKSRVVRALTGRIDSSGFLVIASESSRSQWKNREEASHRLGTLLRGALAVRKRRVVTATPVRKQAERLRRKKARSIRKAERRKPGRDAD